MFFVEVVYKSSSNYHIKFISLFFLFMLKLFGLNDLKCLENKLLSSISLLCCLYDLIFK